MAKLHLDSQAAFLKNCYTLAHLADASYADDPRTDGSFKKTAFTKVEVFQSNDLQTKGILAHDDQHLVLAFRGTDQPEDWLTNLNLRMRDGLGGKVHAGFDDALDSVWAQVLLLLKDHRTTKQLIWLTGHSLGGALATLCAARLPKKLAAHLVCTLGQPRVGDEAFAAAFHANLHRFVNNQDIVPTVPPRFIPSAFPPAFYTHAGQLHFFDEKGDLVLQSSEELGLLPSLLESLGPFSPSTVDAEALVLAGFQDHKLAHYLKCLRKNLP